MGYNLKYFLYFFDNTSALALFSVGVSSNGFMPIVYVK